MKEAKSALDEGQEDGGPRSATLEAIHLTNLIDALQCSKKTLQQRGDLCTLNLKQYVSLNGTARRVQGPHPIECMGARSPVENGIETIEVRQVRLPPDLSSLHQIDLMAFIRTQKLPNNTLKVQLLASIDRDEEELLNPSFTLTLVGEATVKCHQDDDQGGECICLFDASGDPQNDKLVVLQSEGQSYLTVDYLGPLASFVEALEDDSKGDASFALKIEEIKLGSQTLPRFHAQHASALYNSFNLYTVPCGRDSTNQIEFQYLPELSSCAAVSKDLRGLVPKHSEHDQQAIEQHLQETDLIRNYEKKLPDGLLEWPAMDLTA